MNLGTPELLIVLVILLLVFGGTQLPKLARSLGRAQKEFKDGQLLESTDAEPAEVAQPERKRTARKNSAA